MERFTNYLREQLQNEVVVAYVNIALEQYFLDHNKELFLATLKKAITINYENNFTRSIPENPS